MVCSDLNPKPQDGMRRRNHGAMAAIHPSRVTFCGKYYKQFMIIMYKSRVVLYAIF